MWLAIEDRRKRREQMIRELKAGAEGAKPKPEPIEPSLPLPATCGEYVRWEHRRIERRAGRLGAALLPVDPEIEEAMAQFERLSEIWSVHTNRERKALFPRAKEKFGELVAELEQQHARIDEQAARVEALFRAPKETRDARWQAELRTQGVEFSQLIQKHLVREEDGLLRGVECDLPAEERLKIGQEMHSATVAASKNA